MQRKIMLLMATLTALGLVAGVAWAAIPPAELTVSSERVIEVGDAGEVVLALGTSELSVVDVLTNPGWTSETEVAAEPEVEVDFRNADRRIQFNAQLEDGQVRVRIRERLSGQEVASTETTSAVATDDTVTQATTPDSTGTTVDDRPVGPSSGSRTYEISGVATVGVSWDSGTVTLQSYATMGGWTATVTEQRPDRVEIEFENGEDDARFEA